MIYIVTGTQRSGTSMMMGCLKAGGLPVYYNEEKETLLKERHPDTNQGGYFEPSLEEMDSIDFPLQAINKVIKFHAPWRLLGTIKPNQYRIILMHRDPREIVWSLAQFNNGMIIDGDIKIYNRYYDHMKKAAELVRNRRDVHSFNIVDYHEVLEDPVKVFTDLDWPINIKKAVEFVNKDSNKTPVFDFPFSGDIAADLKLGDSISLNQAIIDGKIKVPEDMLEAAKKGAEFGLSYR